MGFLKDFFKDKRFDVWKEVAIEINGEFIKPRRMKPGIIKGYHKNWVIVIDTHVVSSGNSSTIYTQIRAPFVYRDEFQFRIYRKHAFTKIGEFFGMKDIEVGHPEFDNDFFIKGNDPEKLRALFNNSAIRELIAFQPQVTLEIRTGDKWFEEKLPKGINEVHLLAVGVIKDRVRLLDLYDLFIELLEQLYTIGTAEEDAPSAIA